MFCVCRWPLSWFWHGTVHNLLDLYPSPNMNNWITSYSQIGSYSPGDKAHILSVVCGSELIVWMQYTEPSMCTYCTCMLFVDFYFTGESLFSSFFPLESSPFFFLFARSWASRGSRGSSGRWGPLVGLRGLMVPGRRGRTIGDGARTGVALLSTVLVVSGVTWGEKRWGGVEARGSVLKQKKLFHTAD